jgi:predicted RNA-binding Zn-ribbon protein involved in translation (DUF1610 family)
MAGNHKVTFRVEFLTGETVDMAYPDDEAHEIARKLDAATTILGCPECGDLAPVTGPAGAVPDRMPACPACGDPLHGVTEVGRLEGDG